MLISSSRFTNFLLNLRTYAQTQESLCRRLFSTTQQNMKLLSQAEAASLDKELFTEYKFAEEQLMELAGLGCAHAIAKCFSAKDFKRVLICSGPGNNGGDGLVCARHLALMDYEPRIFYPQFTPKSLFEALPHQARLSGIEFLKESPTVEEVEKEYDLVVDAIFGFNFKPPPRPSYEPIIALLRGIKTPIASIDIPSGWDVEKGKLDECDFMPCLLISLTSPKMGSKDFCGEFHYLSGRFIPPAVQEKYQLQLPKYPGTDMCVKL